MVIILISAGNEECKIHKRQAITPYQICNGNNVNNQLICIAGYTGKHEKITKHYNTLAKQVVISSYSNHEHYSTIRI